MTKKTFIELFNFANKVVIITGGSMGIGYGIAKRFAEAGSTIILADVNKDGKKKAELLTKTYGSKVFFVKTDISSEKEVIKLFKTVEKTFKKIDVLVNNAGIYPIKPVLEMDLALWEKTQAINLRGTFLCSREAAKLMIKTGISGSIVNIASVDALHPSSIGLAAYDASKHGVWGFTKNFALETAKHNIRINCIAPGGIRTEGVEKMSQGATKAAENPDAPSFAPMDVPMKRMGEPDEIATATIFLASDAASYMTGSMMVVDGGLLLK
ncbi:MAG: SDR family NAD(P)-dependent oxidoreductase [Patescibacteria group bacterium]|jgi:2-deoxy-D-gluconate 3-dehydrogenase